MSKQSDAEDRFEKLINTPLPGEKRKRNRKPTGRRKSKPGTIKKLAKNSRGYKYINQDGKLELAHRVVKSRELGRQLHDYESVYFKDGNRNNLNPSNLGLGLKPGRGIDEIICDNCGLPACKPNNSADNQ